jgi:hypothetical protein
MKILIAGDSWGCGEWGWGAGEQKWEDGDELDESYIITHRGLEYYLIEVGHDVTNISCGGASNKEILVKLQQLDLQRYDHIIWFQTDPIRDLRPYGDKLVDTFDNLLTKQNSLLDSTYQTLNSFDKKIICLGGCSKLNLDLINKYTNLLPVIPSIPELLMPTFIHPKIWFSDWIDQSWRHFDVDSLDNLVYNKTLQDSIFNNKELFWPDGRHPNRHAHRKLFEYLITYENIS